MEHARDGDTICNWRSQKIHKWIGTGNGGHGNKKTSEDHPIYSIVKIG